VHWGLQGGFESAYIMTGGGPPSAGLPGTPWIGETVGETTTLSYYIFNNAYVYLKMGYAAAMAWILFLLVLIVTLVNWRYGGRRWSTDFGPAIKMMNSRHSSRFGGSRGTSS